MSSTVSGSAQSERSNVAKNSVATSGVTLVALKLSTRGSRDYHTLCTVAQFFQGRSNSVEDCKVLNALLH